MMIKNKQILSIAAITIGTIGAIGISYLLKKHKEEIANILTNEDANSLTDIDDNEMDIEVHDNIVNDVEETVAKETDSEETIIKNPFVDEYKLLRYKFINYLAKNNVSDDTILNICKTILDIQEDLPEEYPIIKSRVEDIMNSEFDSKKIDEFFDYLYIKLYTNVVPCDVFVKYIEKTRRMGDECQIALLDLVEVIDEGINYNNDDAIDAFADMYNCLKYMPEESFNEDTYTQKFKPYVDKFVTKYTKNDEAVLDNTAVVAEINKEDE